LSDDVDFLFSKGWAVCHYGRINQLVLCYGVKQMITRTFLLLLALLSGLSFAQARDSAPAEQDVAGWSAVNFQNDLVAADQGRAFVAFAPRAAQRIDRFLPELPMVFAWATVVVLSMDPLSLSDRLLL
jgi:hypothetical protein